MSTNNIKITNKATNVNKTYSPKRDIKYIVIHYNAGTSSKPGSAVDASVWFNDPTSKASADFIVDESTIVQLNPDIRNWYSWHCGGNKYNTKGGSLYGIAKNGNSIGIEICSTNDTKKVTEVNDRHWSFTTAVLQKAKELVLYLMNEYNIDIDHVIRHYDVTGKPCPGIIGWNTDTGNNVKWETFKADIKRGYEDMEYNQFVQYMEQYKAETDKKPATWENAVMQETKSAGLMDGTRPKAYVTRGELSQVLKNAGLTKK